MTSATEAQVAAAMEALISEGGGPGSSIHSWRCEYPDRYGPCDCVAEAAKEIADAVVVAGPDPAKVAADAGAKALRDAAWDLDIPNTEPGTREDRIGSAGAPDWLRHRANQIEAGQ